MAQSIDWKLWKDRAGLIGGPLLGLAIWLGLDASPERPAVPAAAGIACWMAVWWITEAVPLAATALLPLALFPFFGVAPAPDIAGAYFNTTIFLFLGGFLIALAMERWDLHRRIALRIILLFGSRSSALILGFMAAGALLSMWISNTATAVMMLPMALALIRKIDEELEPAQADALGKALLLGIAYSCSIGGIATPVGTPPNLILRENLKEFVSPEAVPAFGAWMLFALPFSLALLFIVWVLLTRVFFRRGLRGADGREARIDAGLIRRELEELGAMRYEERVVAIVFAATAFLWIFREPLELGALRIPGWIGWIPMRPEFSAKIDDGVVAILMSLLLFAIPARSKRGEAILDADVFRRAPWSIILLFGGGFALAEGFVSSGLSERIVQSLGMLAGVPPILLVLATCLLMTFLTELTSNTASTQMALPVLAAAAFAQDLHPMLLMLPAAIAASMAFMMPVATPPNAIVFSSERLRIADMARVGLALNLLGALLVSFYIWAFAPAAFGFEFSAGDEAPASIEASPEREKGLRDNGGEALSGPAWMSTTKNSPGSASN